MEGIVLTKKNTGLVYLRCLVVLLALLIGACAFAAPALAGVAVEVQSVKPGKLKAAIEAQGVSLASVTSLTVKSGTVNNADFVMLTSLSRLETLDLGGAQITGQITAQFGQHRNIKYVTLPLKAKSYALPKNPFYLCESLVSIDVSGAASFGEGVFFGCKNLTSIKMPTSPYKIPDFAFNACKSLNSIDLSGATSFGSAAFSECFNLASVKMPTSPYTISESTFYSCTSLTSIDLSGATEFGTSAFRACEQLAFVKMPTSPYAIPEAMFGECDSLIEIDVSGATSFGRGAFTACYSLTSVKLPASYAISDSMFRHCESLTEIDVSGATAFGSNAFKNCYSLTSVKLPASPYQVSDSMFESCGSLAVIDVSAATSLGDRAFYGSGINELIVCGTTPPTMGDDVFQYISAPPTLWVRADALSAYQAALQGKLPAGAQIRPILGIEDEAFEPGYIGKAYRQQLSIHIPSWFAWVYTSLDGGALPPGMKLTDGGVLTGVPTQTGAFEFTVKLAYAGYTNTKVLRFQVFERRLTLTPSTTSGNIGDTLTPNLSEAVAVTWQSSDRSVASVDESGVVTYKSPGTATITATDEIGRPATCVVTVLPEIEIVPAKPAVVVGETVALRLSDGNGAFWTSSDPSIASFDDGGKGMLTGKALGTVTITAEDWSKRTATYEMRVMKPLRIVYNGAPRDIVYIENPSGSNQLLLTMRVSESGLNIKWHASVEQPDGASWFQTNDPGTAFYVYDSMAGDVVITATDQYGREAQCIVKARPELSLDASQRTINIGEKFQLVPSLTDGTIEWFADAQGIVEVDDQGNVTGIGAGTVNVTALGEWGSSAKCAVTVRPELTLTAEKQMIAVGHFLYVKPSDAVPVNFGSSDEQVATVGPNGEVKGIGVGTATITATPVDAADGRTAQFEVKVWPVLAVTPGEVTIVTGEELDLSLSEAIDVNWTSSSPEIATVDAQGRVTGLGHADYRIFITATPTDPLDSRSAMAFVTVLAPLRFTHTQTDISEGGTLDWALNEDVPVTLTSSNPKVAYVFEGEEGPEVIGGAEAGNALITATDRHGRTATCQLWVNPGLRIEPGEVTMALGQSISLTPHNGVVEAWSFHDGPVSAVAILNQNGFVKATGEGRATIFARPQGGDQFQGECYVRVTALLTLTPKRSALNVGDTMTTADWTFSDADVTARFTSSDPDVIVIDSAGNLIAVGEGEATITARPIADTSTHPDAVDLREATCDITVRAPLALNASEAWANIGGIVALTPTEQVDVSWTSADESIATVAQDGTVTGVSAGTVVITAIAVDGRAGRCAVTVRPALTISPGQATIVVDENLFLDAGVSEIAKWTTSDDKVATVDDAYGFVTGVAEGEATISARAEDGREATCTVKVVAPLTISPRIHRMNIGETFSNWTLGEAVAVRWTTSNASVATVSGNGAIIGVGGGSATITATDARGRMASIHVMVRAPLTLAPDPVHVYVGGSASMVPSDSISLSWLCVDKTVATVDAQGSVTGVGIGETTVTGVAADGRQASAAVRVTMSPQPGDPPEETPTLTLDAPDGFYPGDEAPLILTGEQSVVSWTSSDKGVATVDENGVVTAVSEGTATITATLSDGRTVSCPITVLPSAQRFTPGIDVLAVGKGKSLILPKLTGYAGTWAVGDESVAKITKNGKQVKALKLGETTLTFTVTGVQAKKAIVLNDRKLKAGDTYTIEFNVRKAGELPSSIVVDRRKLTLDLIENNTAKLSVTVKPKKALDREVFWTSSKPDVATVDRAGNVTAIAPGVAKITAVSANLKRKTVTVTVLGDVTKVIISDKKKKLNVGAQHPLTAIVNEDAIDKSIAWKSNKPGIATVDENGLVTAHKKGKAKIIATAKNGKKATCIVTVK